jgi:hypothetical protein
LQNPYIVPAAIGTPPQPFRLLLDLAWDTLFVPSADCDYDCKDNGNLFFWSNQSSTYTPHCRETDIVYGTDRVTGDLANDTFQIAGLTISDQTFLNAARFVPMGFISFYFGYDGVFGLGPRFVHPRLDHQFSAPSPWSNLVSRSMLPENIFTLTLPHGQQEIPDSHRIGELTLGGPNPKYATANFTSLPVSNLTSQAWITEAQSITWHNTTYPLHYTFPPNTTFAVLDTTSWFLGLPGHAARNISASLDLQCALIDCFVDCNDRKKMPDLTFGIGGQEITVTAFEYVTEIYVSKQSVCVLDLYPTDNQYSSEVDVVVLGRGLLEAFHWVFDLDGGEVRCKCGFGYVQLLYFLLLLACVEDVC